MSTNKTEHSEYQHQLDYIRNADQDRLFAACQTLCGWLSDGVSEQEQHKRKQPCPNCGGEDRFRFAPELDRPHFFCNHCKPTGGWDGIALVEEFADGGKLTHREAVRLLAESIGYETEASSHTSERKQNEEPKMTLQTCKLVENSATFRAVQAHRPEISFEAYERAGAVGFSDDRGLGIAVPHFDNSGNLTTFTRFYARGGKPMNLKGLKSGIVGADARDALLSQRQVRTAVIKCAGISDCMTMSDLINDDGLEGEHYVFTNGAGEGENPTKFDAILCPALEGQNVVVIADNDAAGEKGAQKWAGHLATYAKDVRIIRPPQEWNGKTIKDVRNFVAAAGATEFWCWFHNAVEQAEPVKPMALYNMHGAPRKRGGKVKLVDWSDIIDRPMKFLWHNKLPLGELAVLSGIGSCGKTYIAIHIAKHVTEGLDFADGTPCPQGSVLFFPTEGRKDGFMRRLKAAGIDYKNRTRLIDGITYFDKKTGVELIDPIMFANIEAIEEAIALTARETGMPVKLCVIDPIGSFVDEKTNEYKNTDVRRILTPLQRLADREEILFLLIAHNSKAETNSSQNQVSGSMAWVNVPRVVFQCLVDKGDKSLRYFAPTLKANDLKDPTTVSFRIVDVPGMWEGRIEIVDAGIQKNADDFMFESRQNAKRGRKRSKRDACIDWLLEILAGGDKLQSEIMELSKAVEVEESVISFGTTTVRAAKEELGIESFRERNTDPWRWRLPSASEFGNTD